MLEWQSGPFLKLIVRRLRDCLDVRDRTYRFKTYKSCFVASEAVGFMVAAGIADSRKEAVKLGRTLQERGLWQHVCGDHIFKDEYLFFRFSEHEEDDGSKNTPTTKNVQQEQGSKAHPVGSKKPQFRFHPRSTSTGTVESATERSDTTHDAGGGLT